MPAPARRWVGAGAPTRRQELNVSATAFAFFAIAVAAVLVRFWSLQTQPGGLYPDEAAEGVDARRLIADPGFHPVFFDDDGGREALYAYVTATAFRVFGASVTTLRGTSAALGVLGVALIWLAVRRYGRGAALAAMAWSAGSLWLIAVSRDGFRNILVVPAGALALLAMLRWADRPSRVSALAAGGAMGLGLWTYQPLKFLPLLAIVWLLWMRRRDRERYARLRATFAWCIAAYLIVAAPIIWTAITDARNYFGRGAVVSVFNPGVSTQDSYPVQVLRTLGMFLVTGDPNARHDVNALPLLGPLLFIPFAFGMARAVKRRDDHGHVMLLLGIVVFLIPPLIAPEGYAPHFLRSLGLAPFVAALVGIGCVEIVSLAGLVPRAPRPARAVAATACTTLIAVLGVLSIRTYLDRPVNQRYDAYSFADVELAAAADQGEGTVAVIDEYNSLDVQFLDANNMPTVQPPGRPLAHPRVYSLIVAASRAEIAGAVDAATAARATVAAVDPRGNPVVWEVVP